ncbi:aldehyde dehydrogenase [Thermotoga sp. Ku-13t]|uniref:aldehyde dehydrogenase family protein n=1 Tax=Thermotoga sp. Ku-13t TaxID=1755813 RepID=UPI0013EC73A0|nr:aldehyde dehydrogenase family protein [Thermotoga sp. Ku-13t]KAF2957291.1 aldehyde dehydrogenase [Thermotoga sp. Ku-13t]
MKMLVAGKWIDRDRKIEVLFPYDGSVVDTVPVTEEEDVERALESAVEGAQLMRNLSAYERSTILKRTADLIRQNEAKFTDTIVMEVGKTVKEARAEVVRTAELFELCSEEAKRIHGETIPFDSLKGSEHKTGYFVREPAGVVVAITPFNVPLALCAHKISPAIAAGNAVIVKPASKTPLSTLLLGETLLEAGLPPQALSVLTGPGGGVGMKLVRDRRVRVVSFTGSVGVGEEIAKNAGLKKILMELGSNSPVIVTKSADLQKAVKAVVSGGYSIAGQVCISVQRVYVQREVFSEFVELLLEAVKELKVGDPRLKTTDMGPVIDEQNAQRIAEWFDEAIQAGAKLATGGRRNYTLVEPTVLLEVPKKTKIMNEELFGPGVAVNSFETLQEAIDEANSTRYGLQASIFTSDLLEAFEAIKKLQFGGVLINEGTRYRADFMPYGGYKDSGIGREGVRFAIEELTEIKTVVFETRR